MHHISVDPFCLLDSTLDHAEKKPSKFMNIVMIPIFSWYTCFEICLARRQFVESHLVGFRVCYQHALVQVLCTVSAAVALRDVFFLFMLLYGLSYIALSLSPAGNISIK